MLIGNTMKYIRYTDSGQIDGGNFGQYIHALTSLYQPCQVACMD